MEAITQWQSLSYFIRTEKDRVQEQHNELSFGDNNIRFLTLTIISNND